GSPGRVAHLQASGDTPVAAQLTALAVRPTRAAFVAVAQLAGVQHTVAARGARAAVRRATLPRRTRRRNARRIVAHLAELNDAVAAGRATRAAVRGAAEPARARRLAGRVTCLTCADHAVATADLTCAAVGHAMLPRRAPRRRARRIAGLRRGHDAIAAA